MSSEEFWDLTPREWLQFKKLHDEQIHLKNRRTALICATIHNSAGRTFEPITVGQILGEVEEEVEAPEGSYDAAMMALASKNA